MDFFRYGDILGVVLWLFFFLYAVSLLALAVLRQQIQHPEPLVVLRVKEPLSKLSRSQSLWRQLREHVILSNIGYYWICESMKAQLRVDMEGSMLGRSTKRLRDEY